MKLTTYELKELVKIQLEKQPIKVKPFTIDDLRALFEGTIIVQKNADDAGTLVDRDYICTDQPISRIRVLDKGVIGVEVN